MVVMMLDKEESCSRAGVLKRIPESDLSTPEEFLATRQQLTTDDTGNLAPAAFCNAEDDGEVTVTESTPLLGTTLSV